MKEQDEPVEELSEVEMGDLPKKEFRVVIVKMIKELRRRMDAQNEKLNIFSPFFFLRLHPQSYSCWPTLQLQQCQILNPLSEARD